MDPEYYPNPDVFDPERHSQENKSAIKAGTSLQFGIGPRMCLGMKIAKHEAKILLFQMLRHYR